MAEHAIAIVGATGAVGIKILQLLDERVRKIEQIRLFASDSSEGKTIVFRGKELRVENLESADFSKIDIAFFSAGKDVSMQVCPVALKSGTTVIDNSNAFRMEKEVPLVVPEINSHQLGKNKKLISNPNCSTIQLVSAIGPIHQLNPIERIVVTTFQSVSGSGLRGLSELKNQSGAILEGKTPEPDVYPYPIAFNLIPEIDSLTSSGNYLEEEKIINETCKILESKIKISSTAVRVPTFFCHAESVNLQLQKSFEINDIRATLGRAEDVILMDDPQSSVYPTPLFCQERDEVFVGRIRRDDTIKNGLNMWVVADNLRKGAATNAVKIYEKLVELKLI